MARGKRTGCWQVYFCSFQGSKQVDELIKSGKAVVDKSVLISEIREMAENDTQFNSEHKWELCCFDEGRGYIKFDDDYFDNSKTTYMKMHCYWLDEDEPLKMEWPNHRKWISGQMDRAAERLKKLSREVLQYSDMDVFVPNRLKALRIMMEGPELYVSDVTKSLDKDLGRFDAIQSKHYNSIKFDIGSLLNKSATITQHMIHDDHDNPISLALSEFVHEDVDIDPCLNSEMIIFSIKERGIVGKINMTSALVEWLWDYSSRYMDADSIDIEIYEDDENIVFAGIKKE